jgi:molecular chaperone HtpG
MWIRKSNEVEDESKKKEKKNKKVTTAGHQWELINKSKTLWIRSKIEVTDGKYDEFYKTLTNDWEKYLVVKHFKAESDASSTVLIFVQKRVTYDLFEPKKKLNNVKLYVRHIYVRHIFVMDNRK